MLWSWEGTRDLEGLQEVMAGHMGKLTALWTQTGFIEKEKSSASRSENAFAEHAQMDGQAENVTLSAAHRRLRPLAPQCKFAALR